MQELKCPSCGYMSTDDRALLEAAARAAGLSLFVWGKKGAENFCIKLPGNTPGARWNPLTDDGDALRLAVKLGLFGAPFMQIEWIASMGDSDPLESTRRAIVRAAAALAPTSAEPHTPQR